MTVSEVLDGLSARGSTWTRADVIRAICDRPTPGVLDPGTRVGGRAGAGRRPGPRRLRRPRPGRRDRSAAAVGWPVGVARTDRRPVHPRGDPGRGGTHPHVGARRPARRPGPVAHRRRPTGWTCCRPTPPPRSPATTGWSWSSARPGPARRPCWPAPSTTSTGTAGRCSGWRRRPRRPRCWDTRPAWRPTRSPSCSTSGPAPTGHPLDRYRLAAGATVIVDEAGMVGTAEPRPPGRPRRARRTGGSCWSVTPASCKPSGGAACSPSCAPPTRVHELARLHRFTHPWEAAASLRLRAGDPAVLDVYEAHGRIIAGTLRRAPRPARRRVARRHRRRDSRSRSPRRRNEHVDALNHAIQHARLDAGDLDPDRAVADRRR